MTPPYLKENLPRKRSLLFGNYIKYHVIQTDT